MIELETTFEKRNISKNPFEDIKEPVGSPHTIFQLSTYIKVRIV